MLILVVGPSGSGKDSLLDAARRALEAEGRFVFPCREITRDPALGGEDFVGLSAPEFAARARVGHYALSWQAHGLCYGVPRAVETALAEGRAVVVNASRAVIPEARRRYNPLRVVQVSAPREVLAARLIARGREDTASIRARLDRAAAAVEGADVIGFINERPLAETAPAFVALLRRLAAEVETKAKGDP